MILVLNINYNLHLNFRCLDVIFLKQKMLLQDLCLWTFTVYHGLLYTVQWLILTWLMGIGPSLLVALRGTHLSLRNSMTSRNMKRIRRGSSIFLDRTSIRSKYCSTSFCKNQQIHMVKTIKGILQTRIEEKETNKSGNL